MIVMNVYNASYCVNVEGNAGPTLHKRKWYQATGRGFVLNHITFSENYRLYSRSHFVKGMEVLFLIVVYGIYGFHSVLAISNNLLLLGGLILSMSWIFCPFLFDSSPFDPNKNTEDWKNWNDWRYCKNGPDEKQVADEKGVTIEEKSWEAWWDKELSHIRTTVGRVIETILSLRFFIFPYVVSYKFDVQGSIKSLSICGLIWIVFVAILFFYEVSYKKNPTGLLQFLLVIRRNRVATIGALVIAFFTLPFGDMLAFIIAFITTVWGITSICVAWKPTLEIFSLWTPVNCFAWICDTGMRALNINANADLGMLLLVFLCEVCRPVLEIFGLWTPVAYLAWICDTGMQALSNFNVSEECKALKPKLEIISLWTLVKCLAWICDTGMGALMFKICLYFDTIKQYLVRNLFDQNISELLHNSSAETARQHGEGY